MIRRSIVASLFCAGYLFVVDAAGQTPVLSPPQVLEHVDPVYPPDLLAQGAEATVTIFVTVERDGTVGDATIAESGGAAFDAAALAAVRAWRFAPATRNGAVVRARIRVPIHFAPGPHPAAIEPPAKSSAPAPAPTPPTEFSQGVAGPHAIAEPGKPVEIHVQGKPNPPRRSTSDFRIDRKTLTAAPHVSAADLLSTAPGVYVSHPEGDAVAQRISLRGFDADHGQDIELRVGNIPLNQRSHIHGQGYADLNVVIPETVRSIRVIEGVYDPDQGDFSVAGSMRFDLGVEERGLRAKMSVGSFGTVRGVLLWAPETQSADTFAAAVVRTSDGFGDGTRGSISGGATGQYRFELPGDVSGLVHVAAYGGRAGIAGVVRRDDVYAGRIGFYDAYPDATARAQSALASRTQASVTLERSDNDGSATSAGIWAMAANYRSRLNFTGYMQRGRQHPEWVGRGDLIEQSNQDIGFGGRFTYRSRKMNATSWLKTQVSTGIDVQTNLIDQAQNLLQTPQNETWDRRVDASIQATDIGFYADGLFAFSKYVRLHAGLRADVLIFDIDDRLGNFIPPTREVTRFEGFRRTATGIAFGPRATLEADPWRWLKLVASYGEGYRSPQARQLQEGEPAPFSKVRSYEIGAQLHEAPTWSLATALYETRLSLDMAFDATEGRMEFIGPTRRRGVVAYLQVNPNASFSSSISGTFVDATLESPPPPTPENPTPPYSEGQRLPFVPPFVLRADVRYERDLVALRGSPVVMRLGYGTSFLSPRPLPYNQQAAPVFLVDASASWRWKIVEIGADVTNLFNVKYADTEYSFVSNWAPSAIPSALPARHLAAGAPLTILGNVLLYL
ncbi:MAG TPA: TonB-dependent receptor [Polyangium sp.]|nr:TonB-dependent receptor [Polyangium sp.]